MQSLQYGSRDPDELEVAVKTKAKTQKTNNQVVILEPPQEQHGGGGGDGDAAAPGRNRCAHSLHNLCMRDIRFAPGLT